MRREDPACSDLGDSNPDHRESNVNEKYGVDDIEEPQSPPRRSRRARRTPVRFSDTVIVAVEDLVTCEEAMRASKKKEWKLAQKEEVYSIENNNTEPKLSCRRARIPSLVRWY